MGKPAARLTDMHVCPMVTGVVPHVGGPIIPPTSPNVLTGMLLQARIGDMLTCVGPPDVIVMGSPTVLVNGMPAARLGDMTAHGGTIVLGCLTVLIGEGGGGGGGGGGSGSPVATTSGSSSASTMLGTAGASIAPAQQAAVYKAAAKSASPFVERCQP